MANIMNVLFPVASMRMSRPMLRLYIAGWLVIGVVGAFAYHFAFAVLGISSWLLKIPITVVGVSVSYELYMLAWHPYSLARHGEKAKAKGGLK